MITEINRLTALIDIHIYLAETRCKVLAQALSANGRE